MAGVSVSKNNEILFSFKFDPGIFKYELDAGGRLSHIEKGMTPCWAPDGKLIAFQLLKPLVFGDISASLDRFQFVDREYGKDPSWSSDGLKIAYTFRIYLGEGPFPPPVDKVKVFNINSRELEIVADGESPTWSPNGNRLAYWVGGSLAVMDYQTREAQYYTSSMLKPETKESESRFEKDLSWSPTRDQFLYVARWRRLFVWDIESKTIKLCEGIKPYAAGWLPDGKRIAFVGHLDGQDRYEDQAGLYIYSVAGGGIRHIMYVMHG